MGDSRKGRCGRISAIGPMPALGRRGVFIISQARRLLRPPHTPARRLGPRPPSSPASRPHPAHGVCSTPPPTSDGQPSAIAQHGRRYAPQRVHPHASASPRSAPRPQQAVRDLPVPARAADPRLPHSAIDAFLAGLPHLTDKDLARLGQSGRARHPAATTHANHILRRDVPRVHHPAARDRRRGGDGARHGQPRARAPRRARRDAPRRLWPHILQEGVECRQPDARRGFLTAFAASSTGLRRG